VPKIYCCVSDKHQARAVRPDRFLLRSLPRKGLSFKGLANRRGFFIPAKGACHVY